MAYYAFLDENNIVTEVITGKNENEDNIDWEIEYGKFRNQKCKRTSYNTHGNIYYTPNTSTPDPDQSKAFRKNYAGIGYSYNIELDAFIPPQPFLSWLLDSDTGLWKAPIPYPNDDKSYYWNEKTQSWDVVNEN